MYHFSSLCYFHILLLIVILFHPAGCSNNPVHNTEDYAATNVMYKLLIIHSSIP